MGRKRTPEAAEAAATPAEAELHPLVLARMESREPKTALASRMLAIESALYVALEARGHEARPGLALVNGERFTFWLYEPERRTRVALKPKEWGYRAGEGVTKQVMVPSGQPTLVVQPDDCTHGGGERRWAARPGRPIERQVERIVTRLEAITKQMAESRIRSAEYDRELEIAMRRAARRLRREREEKARPGMLRNLTADWQEAARIRAFLDALEARLASHPSREALQSWLQWARSYVQVFDPLSGASLGRLEAHAAILNEPQNEEEPDPDEQEWRDMGLLDEYM
jgi:hypothetical protein